jgi:hypothetical protein
MQTNRLQTNGVRRLIDCGQALLHPFHDTQHNNTVILLNAIMLNAIMLSVTFLYENVVMLNVIMLNVVAPVTKC